MCGRFAVTTDPAVLAAEIDAVDETPATFAPNFRVPNYNVAPSTDIAVVVHREDRRRIRLMRWGLLLPRVRARLINARAERITTSPAYRSAAAHRRCLIPMDGYYEWRGKTPFYFSRTDGKPLLVAGLWSGDPVRTCAVITTDAVGGFEEVHERMPLVLAEPEWDRWLDPCAPAPADLLAARPDIGPMAMRPQRPERPDDQPVGLF